MNAPSTFSRLFLSIPVKLALLALALFAGGVLFLRQPRSSSAEQATPAALAQADPAPIAMPSRPDAPPPDERAPAATAVLEGRLLGSDGMALAGAQLTWIALDPAWTAETVRPYVDDGRLLLAAQVSAETDAQGDFKFDVAPALAREQPSAVWVTHPSIEAEAVLLEAGAANWRWPAEHAWRSAEPIEVRTLDLLGQPVAGAWIGEFLVKEALGVRTPTEANVFARKFFVRTYKSDERGIAYVAAAEGRRALYARCGELRAAPDWASGPAAVTLTLRPTFELSGTVVPDELGVDLCPSYIAVFETSPGADPAKDKAIALRIAVRSDGGFGPVTCVVPVLPRLRLSTRGGLLLESAKEFAAPRPGERVFETLDGVVGAPLRLCVRDSDAKEIVGAWSDVCMDPLNAEGRYVSAGNTDEHGRVQLTVPRTHPFLVSAGREGFATVETPVQLWSRKLESLEITLPHACTLRGRVVCGSRPVTRFQIATWTKDVFQSLTTHFEDAQGRFELKGQPPGKLFFFIEPAEFAQSRTYQAELRPDGSDEFLIELSEPVSARGQAIDSRTRAAVSPALVTRLTNRGDMVLHKVGEPIAVDAQGFFELPAIGEEGSGFVVEAQGYAPAYGLARRENGKWVIGIMPLQPTASVSVKLRPPAGEAAEHYTLYCDVGFPIPTSAFPASGELDFTELPANAGFLTLVQPDGSTLRRALILDAGLSRVFEFDLRAGRDLGLRFQPDSLADEARGGSLRIHARDPVVSCDLRTQPLAKQGALVARGLPPGACTLEVFSPLGKCVGSVAVEIGPAGPSEVLVQAATPKARLRILDRERKPLVGVRVDLCAAEEHAPWQERGETGSDGELEFGPAPCARGLVCLSHATAGRAFAVPVDFARAAETPQEIVLDCREHIRVQSFEDGAPREGVRLKVRHPSGSAWTSFLLTCRENGIGETAEVGEGTYTIEVSSGGLWPTRHVVNVPQKTSPERIDLVGLADLHLVALDAYDEPQAGVRFELEGVEVAGDAASWLAARLIGSSTPDLATDSDGEFTLRNLPATSLRWRASAPDGTRAQGEIRLAAGKTNELRARLH